MSEALTKEEYIALRRKELESRIATADSKIESGLKRRERLNRHTEQSVIVGCLIGALGAHRDLDAAALKALDGVDDDRR